MYKIYKNNIGYIDVRIILIFVVGVVVVVLLSYTNTIIHLTFLRPF